MASLKAIYEEMKFKNIVTYIQSGNVIFSTGQADPQTLSGKIEKKILEKYGFKVPVIIRTADEIQAIVKINPFLKIKNIATDRLHVTFLADNAGSDLIEKIKEYHYEPDKFIIIGKEVYLSCPDGYGNSKLNNTFFENKLKVTATTRNWRTVNELLRIALQA